MNIIFVHSEKSSEFYFNLKTSKITYITLFLMVYSGEENTDSILETLLTLSVSFPDDELLGCES